MGGFLQQLEVFEGHRRRDDLHLSGITNGVAQTNITAVFTTLAGFCKHLTFRRSGLTSNDR